MADEASNSGVAPPITEPPLKLTALQTVNLALLLVLAALAGIWLSAYTEWIPHLKRWASGDNGLFFAAAIAALVWGAATKPCRRFLLFLLTLPVFSAVLVTLLLVLGWFAASHGSLRLELTKDFREGPVEVFDSSRHRLAHRIPPADGEFRELVPASLFASSTVWFAVKNRPYEPVGLTGFWRRPRVSVPSDLKREVVLLYGDEPFLRFTANGPGADLTIDIHRRDGRLLRATRAAYKGQTLWLGCRSDVELPSSVKEALQQEIMNPEQLLLRPTCPYEKDDACEFTWDSVTSATVQWKLGKRGKKLAVEFENLAKIGFVRRRAIEF